jgi:hypothetical protein
MNDIDLMTLKLLSSKKKYNQYLANAGETDNSKYKNAVLNNVDGIKAVLSKYLLDPEMQICNDLDNAVEQCFKAVLDHLTNVEESKEEEYENENVDSTYDYVEPKEEEQEEQSEISDAALEYLRV